MKRLRIASDLPYITYIPHDSLAPSVRVPAPPPSTALHSTAEHTTSVPVCPVCVTNVIAVGAIQPPQTQDPATLRLLGRDPHDSRDLLKPCAPGSQLNAVRTHHCQVLITNARLLPSGRRRLRLAAPSAPAPVQSPTPLARPRHSSSPASVHRPRAKFHGSARWIP